MVPKHIGSEVVRKLQYIGQTPHKYVHMDMKLNFMHILADLGFGGVYPIYWIKEGKHAIIYTWSKYACQDLQEPNEDTIWTQYQEYQEGTPKCDMQENCPNYVETQINTLLRKIPKEEIPNERYIKEWDN